MCMHEFEEKISPSLIKYVKLFALYFYETIIGILHIFFKKPVKPQTAPHQTAFYGAVF